MQLAKIVWPTQKTSPESIKESPSNNVRHATSQHQETVNEKILLLHGMGGTASLWRPIAAMLEDRFDILALDQRGHGKSQITVTLEDRDRPSYTPLDFGQDVVETITKEKFHPCWMVGHSMGVRTAIAAAHLNPALVRGLVLIDLGLNGAVGVGFGNLLASFLKGLPLEFSSRHEARDEIMRTCPDPSIGQYLLAVSVKGADGRVTFPFDRAALIETITAARDVSVREWALALAAGGIPLLFLRGALSRVWGHEDFLNEQVLFKKYPSAVFEEIPGAGHGLPFEKRLDFVARLQKFIESRGVI